MRRLNPPFFRSGKLLATAAFLVMASPALLTARTDFTVTRDPIRQSRASARDHYKVVPLVSDGIGRAPVTDDRLVNPWGLARCSVCAWLVADNGTDATTIYSGDGTPSPLVISFPAEAALTGIDFNATQSFTISDGTLSAPAIVMFAGEGGQIFAWHPALAPPPPSPGALLVLDSSTSGSIYKGLAIATTAAGDRLYATDFHNGKVDVFDGSFQPVNPPAGSFLDPAIPAGFAPFGIQNLQGRIVVTYAKQDADAEDDVAGRGNGFVSVFDPDGVLISHLASRGPLNSPWGIALAPDGFGRFGGDLLVGNFGSGTIAAYKVSGDLSEASLEGVLFGPHGRRIVIHGLWALGFGNDGPAGPSDALFFTAGPGDEEHGLFGRIEAR